MSNNYQRLFYIFKNLDNDLGNPSGYIKIEINGNDARIQTALNNLPNRQEFIYELYGIIKDERELRYTAVCDIQHVNGRADIRVNADSQKIGSKGLNLDEINIFAVIARIPNEMAFIRCPLVAYKKEELAWRRDFEASLYDSLRSDSLQISSLPDTETVPDSRDFEPESPADAPESEEAVREVIPDRSLEEEVYEDAGIDVPEEVETEQKATLEETERETEEVPQEDYGSIINDDLASRFESTITSIYNGDRNEYREQEPFRNEDDILDSAQRDFEEISSINQEEERLKTELDMQSLKDELDKSFEICSPFKVKSKRFKWWKINSPGYLNNILFRNNVKTYLLFNPKVMLAHYKYRYIIFGVRSDRNLGRERLICGVPGIYSIDENPFGNIGSWAQVEGYKPKYGAFGYWIILIDPRTGKLIKITNR